MSPLSREIETVVHALEQVFIDAGRPVSCFQPRVSVFKSRLFPARNGLSLSRRAETLSVPGCGYGLDVIVEVGYQRFWLQRTVQEIQRGLKDRVPISERQILNLLAHFLALLRAAQPAKVAKLHPGWQKLAGLVRSIDGMQPEKGNSALDVVREVQLEVTLLAEILEMADHQTRVTALFDPIKGWGLPVKGIISDAQESIRLAVSQVWPDKPHPNCQFHCLKEAGRLTFDADRALKTPLKKKLRGRLNRARQAIQDLPETNPYRSVLLKYVHHLRFTLLVRSLPPFDLGGLRMGQQLTTLQAVAQHLVTTFRNRWWGLFVCYDVPGLPATNNNLESFFGRLKTNQRRITGRKSVNSFGLRYRAYATFVDLTGTKADLLARLGQVDRATYQRARQQLKPILAEQQDYHRFCHNLDAVVQQLETEWQAAVEAATWSTKIKNSS